MVAYMIYDRESKLEGILLEALSPRRFFKASITKYSILGRNTMSGDLQVPIASEYLARHLDGLCFPFSFLVGIMPRDIARAPFQH